MKQINRYLGTRENNNTPILAIRRMDQGGWYWINKNIMKVYAKQLGASAIAVYNVLAFFSNAKTQACYPSHKTIGEIAGMSKKTVSQKMRQLEKAGLISRKQQNGQTICYLLDARKGQIVLVKGEESSPSG